ncbi:MAG: ATP-binding protein [Solirubrobacteraceae bacterium]
MSAPPLISTSPDGRTPNEEPAGELLVAGGDHERRQGRGDLGQPDGDLGHPGQLGAQIGVAGQPRWLEGVRLRASREVLWLRHAWSAHHYEGEHVLSIAHSEVDRALVPPADVCAAKRAFYRSDERAAALSAAIAELNRYAEDPRFEHLTVTLSLARGELALLTLTLAVAIDPSIARVFGYMLDVTEPADPTPALATTLFELPYQPCLGPDSALVRWGLAEPVLTGRDAYACATGWRVDTRLLRALAGSSAANLRAAASRGAAHDATDWSAGTSGRLVAPPDGLVLREATIEEICEFVRALRVGGESTPPIEIELVGASGSGRTTLAAHVAARLGTKLVAVDAAALADAPDALAAATREARRARLDGSALAWEHAELLPAQLWEALPPAPLAFLSVEQPASGTPRRSIRRSFRCEPIDRAERIRLWSSLSAAPAPPAVAEWGLRPAEIVVAAQAAPAGDHEVAEVCRRFLAASRPDLLSPLPLPFTWNDLVLPAGTAAHLREFEAQARYRGAVLDDWGLSRLTSLGRGTTALFAGPSGTGKTMATQVLARSLGLELYRVDLAGVVNKYIGETEKHLRELFEVCERAPVLLLFDEADALFGKRSQVSDAHDRYANIEIDYLLQRMEQFDGVAVLATNRRGDLDTAFVRRLRFIIEFAPPSVHERERLWRLALQDATDTEGRPLADELDWAGLARELDLTGAGIKSAAVAAAFLARTDGARIAARHVLAAAKRELEKQGIVVRPGQMDLR